MVVAPQGRFSQGSDGSCPLIVSEAPSDRQLRELLITNPKEGWRVFIEHYTPRLLGIIEHAGVRRHDDMMDVYVRICEHLAAADCARLRRHDPAKGPLAAWLTVVARRVLVDWVRSRKGRRRLFQSIRELSPLDREVFELRYWKGHPGTAIVELLAARGFRRMMLVDVFESLERIERALSSRQRSELLAMMARAEDAVSLDDESAPPVAEPIDAAGDPERQLRSRQTSEALDRALAQLPPEEALIVSLLYVEGLSRRDVERGLHIPPLTAERTRRILDRLRQLLAGRGIEGVGDVMSTGPAR